MTPGHIRSHVADYRRRLPPVVYNPYAVLSRLTEIIGRTECRTTEVADATNRTLYEVIAVAEAYLEQRPDPDDAEKDAVMRVPGRAHTIKPEQLPGMFGPAPG